MKKTRNFVGAVAIALAFMFSPAPVDSAVVEPAEEGPAFVRCVLIHNSNYNGPPTAFIVPAVVGKILVEQKLAKCGPVLGEG